MSKAWNWEINKETIWLEPSIESYYYCQKWKNMNFKDILDLGCGLGRHSILFSKYDFNIFSCDLSFYSINHLNNWANKEGLKVNTTVCDMHNLPYSTNSFDAIFAYHTISHTNTIGMKKIIGEIKRVLKTNGEVFLTLCSKDTWSFKEAGYPKLDENTVIKKEDGPEMISLIFM